MNHGATPLLLRAMEERSGGTVAAVTVALVALLGWGDMVTGWELSFSIFYLIPVAMGSWRGGTRAALALALLSTIAWFGADQLAGHAYSQPWIPYWNASVRFALFLAVGLTLAALHATLRRANALARVDSLTGVGNSRAFDEQLTYHMELARRHRDPISLAAIDLDNFKPVNDSHGHAAGDEALRKVAAVLSHRLRTVDVIARVGGDEFAALLPRTDGDHAALALEDVRAGIEAEMKGSGWPITVSVGLATCRGQVAPADLRLAADRALYRAKADGRNRILIERMA